MFKRQFHRLSKTQPAQLTGLLVVVVAVAGIGTYLLLRGHAAVPAAATSEAELGTRSGNTSTVSDTSASGGSALRFGLVASDYIGPYTVSGNKILDAHGKQVILHGVDRPTLHWNCTGNAVTGAQTGIPDSDFTTMRIDWNANAVRIPLNQDLWLSGAAQYCPDYANNVHKAVLAARANGLMVILDLHWSDKGNLAQGPPPAGSTNQQCMADQNSVTFWQEVANIYKSNTNVWFELYNEPQNITWAQWQNGASVCGFQTVGMQQLVDTVRATGATNIVIAGGTGYSSHLDFIPLLTGGNVAYAIHPYAADITGGDPDSWTTANWDTKFGNLAATQPVIATEFGDLQCGGTTYDQAILDYFRAHKIGYTAWAWWVGGCKFPSLITNAAGTCVDSMGCTIQQDMKNYP